MAEGVFCADLMEWYRSNYRKIEFQRTDKKEEGKKKKKEKRSRAYNGLGVLDGTEFAGREKFSHRC